MSTGLVLGVVGGVVGGFIGGATGAQIGYAVGSGVGSYVDYLNTPDVQGPRLTDFKISDSSYGRCLARVWGHQRVAAQLIRALPVVEVATEEDVEGAKGDGPKQIVYTYFFSGAIAIASGKIAGIGKVWANGDVIFDATPRENEKADYTSSDLDLSSYIRLYKGSDDQGRDPRLEAHDPDCSSYPGIAYIFFENLPLKQFNNALPNLEVEVIAGVERDLDPTGIRTPELLTYLPDNGSQAAGRLMVTKKKNYVSFSIGIMPWFGGNILNDSWQIWSMPPRQKPRILTGGSSSQVASFRTDDPVLFGPNIKPDTPTSNRGRPGIDSFPVRTRRGGRMGWARKALHEGQAAEVFSVGNGFGAMPLFQTTEFDPPTLFGDYQYPMLAAETSIGIVFKTRDRRHQILGRYALQGEKFAKLRLHTDFENKVEPSLTRTVYELAAHPTLDFFFAATSPENGQGPINVHMCTSEGIEMTSVHPRTGTAILLHMCDDGYLYSACSGPLDSVSNGFYVHRWKPGTNDAWEYVCVVRKTWAVPSTQENAYLGQARGREAHIGSAGPEDGHSAFYTDGKRLVFNAGVGNGLNDGFGGEGLAGCVISRYNDFGADIEPVTVGDIVADICRECGLSEENFDVTELEEPIFGFASARRTIGRSNIEPLRTYLPFDCVETGKTLRFRARGRDETFVIEDDDLGAEHES